MYLDFVIEVKRVKGKINKVEFLVGVLYIIDFYI